MEVNLWKGAIQGAAADTLYQEKPTYKNGSLQNTKQVVVPTLTIYTPEHPNGTAVVICPGGGYEHLAMRKEGFQIAEWLNGYGITAFVLKYRLPSDRIMEDKSIGPLQDGLEAIRYVRRNAEELGLDKDKIGIMGFSAGGHLAATVSTYNTNPSLGVPDPMARINFSLLIYPVISMKSDITHKGSRNNLLGNNPSKEMCDLFSTELHMNADTSPVFLVHASDDGAVPVENSILYYEACTKSGVPAELHIYEKGGHGFGLTKNETGKLWPRACEDWLRVNRLIE